METKVEKPLVVLSITEYAKTNGIVTINPKVHHNTNGYPFVTMIDAKNEATNVYFSKAASGAIVPQQPITAELLKAHQIGITTNAAGEERIKLISNSERLDLFELLS